MMKKGCTASCIRRRRCNGAQLFASLSSSGLQVVVFIVLHIIIVSTGCVNINKVDACFQPSSIIRWPRRPPNNNNNNNHDEDAASHWFAATTTTTTNQRDYLCHGRRGRNVIVFLADNNNKPDNEKEEPTSSFDENEVTKITIDNTLTASSSSSITPMSTTTTTVEELQNKKNKKKKTFVVVGAGWAGWGAAKALCESNCENEVIIIDSIPDPTGRTPFLSPTGKPIEAGTRGFWKDYPNINTLITHDLNLNEHDIFTDFTNSSFYSPFGLEATSPVFAKSTFPDTLSLWPGGGLSLPLPPFLAGTSLQNFPSPLGQVLASADLFERLPVVDRASVFGFLLATIDCIGSLYDENDETIQQQYDRMTGHDLFIRFGLSRRLVDDILRPLVLVCLFKPPEELSALVTLELFYFFTLAHMDSFDVRWIKNGTVTDSIIAPLATRLIDQHNLTVLGGCSVGKITLVDDDNNLKEKSGTTKTKRKKVSTVEYTRHDDNDGRTKKETIHDVDGVILALTCRGMRAVVAASQDLAEFPVFGKAASCNEGIDVMSVRLWLNTTVATRTPSNIFSSQFDALRGAGGTFFMLDQLQNSNEALKRLWGKHGNDDDDDDHHPLGSVVACDFYNAAALLPLSDHDIVEMLIKDLLPAAVAEFANTQVVDSWIGRYPGAVSWFAPGTFEKRPPIHGAGSLVLPNLKCAGDWVRMENHRESFSAKGLCQERAYVSGLHAANDLMKDTIGRDTSSSYKPHKVIPIRDDEVQFKASVALNKQVMKVLPRFWVR